MCKTGATKGRRTAKPLTVRGEDGLPERDMFVFIGRYIQAEKAGIEAVCGGPPEAAWKDCKQMGRFRSGSKILRGRRRSTLKRTGEHDKIGGLSGNWN